MAKIKKTSGVPGILAFSRKLEVSDALFASTSWAERHGASSPVLVKEKYLRGTISNRFKTADVDPTKIDAAMESANLQTVDFAALPAYHDTLKVTFTTRVLGQVGVPTACGDFEFRETVINLVYAYQEQFKFSELARRYVINLANGRFLWRNGIGSSACEVHIENSHDQAVHVFDALDFSHAHFDTPDSAKSGVDHLSELVGNALSGNDGKTSLLLSVTAYVRLGCSQEVFPSQELILEKEKNKKSRTLYVVDGQAGMHSQKLSNAVRTIDSWHPDAQKIGPIAAEPYGAVTTMSKAFRQPQQKIDFYNLFDKWTTDGQAPSVEQQHYVMAILIRGGIFGAVGN